jgi:hypothetical protein
VSPVQSRPTPQNKILISKEFSGLNRVLVLWLYKPSTKSHSNDMTA